MRRRRDDGRLARRAGGGFQAGRALAAAVVLLATAAVDAAPAVDRYRPAVAFPGEHGGHHRAYPELRGLTAAERRNGRALLRTMAAVARSRFPTVTAAERLGFRRGPRSAFVGMELPRSPGVRSPFVHYRSAAYDRDRRVLDPRRPEALVYWERPRGEPVLVGFMFRASSLRRPPDPHRVGRLLNWHAHAACDARREPRNPLQFAAARCRSGVAHHGTTQMTHVWLAAGLRAGFAGAVPVREIGIFIAGIPGLYDESRHGHDGGHGHDSGATGHGDHHHGVELSAAEATVANAWAVSLLAPLAALMLAVRGPRREAGPRLLAIVLLAGVALAHAEHLGGHVHSAPYLAVMFCLLIAACIVLAIALAVEWRPRAAWTAAVAVSAGAIVGYVASRTVGLPEIGDHVGDWDEPAAVAALVFEAAVVALGVAALRSRRGAVARS